MSPCKWKSPSSCFQIAARSSFRTETCERTFAKSYRKIHICLCMLRVCVYLYKDMYMYMYMYMYMCMCMCMYVCMYACMHACMHVCIYLYAVFIFYVFIHLRICIYLYTPAPTFMYAHTTLHDMYMRIQTYVLWVCA